MATAPTTLSEATIALVTACQSPSDRRSADLALVLDPLTTLQLRMLACSVAGLLNGALDRYVREVDCGFDDPLEIARQLALGFQDDPANKLLDDLFVAAATPRRRR